MHSVTRILSALMAASIIGGASLPSTAPQVDAVNDGAGQQKTAAEKPALETMLFAMICSDISAGVEACSEDPAARNVALTAAQDAYLADPTEENRSALQSAVAAAYQAAYDNRIDGIIAAKAGGSVSARDLFERMLDEAYLTRQYEALTGQPDLYERMDRMAAFGMCPNDSETPYMADESQALYLLLRAYWENPTETNLQTALGYFSRLYDEALHLQFVHLEGMGLVLDDYIAETTAALEAGAKSGPAE